MIIFDGVDIQSIADIDIEDIRVSPIDFNPVSRPRAIDPGSYFVRNRAGTRTVSITFAVLTQDKLKRQTALMAISAWAKTDAEYRLELPGHPQHYLMAVCTAKPEPSLRQWWESKLRLVFTCFNNPFWNDITEKNKVCGTEFTVLGDAPPLMRIERTLSAAASNQSYGLDGKTITFSTIPAGDLVIDLNAQTAVVDNTSIMGAYNVNSRFLVPRTGIQTVTGTGVVKWRERWQ